MSINHHSLAPPERFAGEVKDSGSESDDGLAAIAS